MDEDAGTQRGMRGMIAGVAMAVVIVVVLLYTLEVPASLPSR
jgi:tetrahydromethanopterin S-methyltransferase subunit F